MNKYYYNERYFESIDTSEKAYWLGFLYADGCVVQQFKNGRVKAMHLELCLTEIDRKHISRFVCDIGSNVPIKEKIAKIEDKTYKSVRVAINNTKICRDLIALGCVPCKSNILRFPSLNVVPEEYLSHFIRGYFDGDGCMSYTERMQLDRRNGRSYLQKKAVVSIVGTKDFLSMLVEHISKSDVFFTFVRHPNSGNASEIRITSKENLRKFYDLIYKDESVCLQRKKEKYEYALKRKYNPRLPRLVTSDEKSGKNDERLTANIVLNN